MKANFYKIVLAFLLLGSFSCSSDDKLIIDETVLTCFDGILNGDEITVDCGGVCPGFCPLESTGILEGELVSRLRLDPSIEYRVSGPFLVRDKAELSIPAGTVIKVDPGIGAYIAVTQGGRLNATGQPDNPVVITSGAENPAPGDWGGLIIHGKAPINTNELGRSDILDIFYGGEEFEDTSGVINYLRVEYAGALANKEKKFDAITFYGVGSFTTVTRLQAYKSLGNGIRFVGGNVNSKWLVTTDSGESGLVVSNDWNGKSEFWHLSGNANSGIEISSDKEFSEGPIAMPMDSISSISIIGTTMESGLKYKSGNGNFTFSKIHMSNLKLGIQVENGATANIDQGNFVIDSVQFENTPQDFMPTNYSGGNPSFYTEAPNSGAGNGSSKPEWAEGWTKGLD